MATEIQIDNRRAGGGRVVRAARIDLSLTAGHVGVIGFGAITGGAGGTNGTYPLVLTGGTVSGGPASGVVTVTGGAISAIALTDCGDYTVAPAGISIAGIPGLAGASVASVTTAQLARGSFTPPAGSQVSGFHLTNAVAIGGAPTNMNVTVGKTFGGADYVAAVDLKAAGSTEMTLVVAGLADLVNWPGGPIFIRAVIVGVTVATGSPQADITYRAPNA